MSTSLAVFDTTVQETNLWLKQLMERMHTQDRQAAYLALRPPCTRCGIVWVLRMHLGAQLPFLLRGVYYEGWHIGPPSRERQPEDFIEHVRAELPRTATLDANLMARSALAVLQDRLDPGEVAKIKRVLPHQLHTLWPA